MTQQTINLNDYNMDLMVVEYDKTSGMYVYAVEGKHRFRPSTPVAITNEVCSIDSVIEQTNILRPKTIIFKDKEYLNDYLIGLDNYFYMLGTIHKIGRND